MGTHTDFVGAVRIRPCIKEPLAAKLEDFFCIRHMKRDRNALYDQFPNEALRKRLSLFGDGDFGLDGVWFMPCETKDLNRSMMQGKLAEGLIDQMSTNVPPEPCPSLYCDLTIVHDAAANCSYLGWNGNEKPYRIADWIRLLAEWLVLKGYTLDGRLFAQVEYGLCFYYITVRDADVNIEDFEPEVMYQTEFENLMYE